MSIANPLWGAARIRGELLKLGIKVSERSIRRYRVKGPRWPSPGWRAFIRSHMKDTVATDMFVVVTLTYRLLYGMIILEHDRRKILHFAVTARPTDEWLSKQMQQAFLYTNVPRFIVRDRDALYGKQFCERLKQIGIQEVLTAPQSPWQNTYVERVIWTIRRECLDHVIVINERHLRGILESYIKYYNRSRTHNSLDEDCPDHRPVEPPSNGAKIVAIPEVGGLHHRYTRRAA
jgi:transposase InsO family protein